MLVHRCACRPVVNDLAFGSEIIGVVCERDLVCRVVAEGLDPVMSTVWLAMTIPANTVHDNATVEECVLRLRHQQSERLVVVDLHGHPCGMITQGDVARQGPPADRPLARPPTAERTCSGRLMSARTPSSRLRATRPTVILSPISLLYD